MNSKTLKPYVKQALDLLGTALSKRPLLLYALHAVESVILYELDSGTLDDVIGRATIDLGEKPDAP